MRDSFRYIDSKNIVDESEETSAIKLASYLIVLLFAVTSQQKKLICVGIFIIMFMSRKIFCICVGVNDCFIKRDENCQ